MASEMVYNVETGKDTHCIYHTIESAKSNHQEEVMDAKQTAAVIVARLAEHYPAAECTLDYNDAWKLLVAVRLAAQCTDARVNIVTAGLFERYPSPRALADCDLAELTDTVRPCGLGNSKARDIKACMTVLCEKYDGCVPDTMEALLALPGVGRKSANLILGDIFGKPAVVTDTHCIRLCGRFGLTDSKEPVKVERRLWELLDPNAANDFCHRLVLHGRAVCTAHSPKCDSCFLNDICAAGLTRAARQ